ncbi:lysozyme inhibitor LprI family protein [Lichenibacterium dinghuense]|uniref:lysozyme inhibitor LprI family protein n=1 Tax=Lichenibacterium dinghuense TaxID=2895977 RepID=UPI001F387156|nr:lysozyme inhibitor LprI family protein [Lichenibacterium sp. 6Y81]
MPALLGLALLAGPARAKQPDWADAPESKRPDYAASRAICAKLKGVVPPAADAPTPAEAASLADCSSEALYFGIARPADPKAARLCAFVEKRNADPQVTNFGYTGDNTLMLVYANGLGAARNLDVATALACRVDGAPAENDGRVKHLADLKAKNWQGTDFSLCDDITSGLMMGVCAAHEQLITRAKREATLAKAMAGWSPAERAAFAPLKRAEGAFADAHGRNEVDLSGTGRGAFETEAEEQVNDAFLALVGDVDAGRVAADGAAGAKAADDALNAAYKALLARAPELSRYGSGMSAAGFAETERLWIRYRDAWVAFAKVRKPDLAPDALLARLSRERAAQLKAVAGG